MSLKRTSEILIYKEKLVDEKKSEKKYDSPVYRK